MKYKHLLIIFLAPLCACSGTGLIKKLNAAKTDMPNNPGVAETLYDAERDNLHLPKEIYASLRSSDQLGLGSIKAPRTKQKFDINAEDVDAKLFFLNLAKDTPYNIVVHDDVSGRISLELNSVTFQDVLDTVKNVYGYDYTVTGKTIEILPAVMQTRAFTVNYLDVTRQSATTTVVQAGGSSSGNSTSSTDSSTTASTGSSTVTNTGGSDITLQNNISSQVNTSTTSDFWQELKATVETMVGTTGGRRVTISPLAGQLVVTAMPSEIKQVAAFLKNAEFTLNRQVILEAKIMEVTLGENARSGVDWAFLSGRFRLAQLGGDMWSPTDMQNIHQIGNVFPVPVDPGPFSLQPNLKTLPAAGISTSAYGGLVTMAFNYKNLSSFVELLETQGKVQVLSSPRVSTLNHQKALIKVGTDDYFVTNVSSTTTIGTGGQTLATPNVTFQSFFSGISLDVIPHVSKDDHVTLHIHPSISNVTNKSVTVDLGSTLGSQTYPLASSSVRESDSIVRAKNGQVVVIGGLMQDQHLREEAGIPILKNIPGIGNLFKQHRSKKQKSELVIILRTIVVDDDSCTWNKDLQMYMNEFEDLEQNCNTDIKDAGVKGR